MSGLRLLVLELLAGVLPLRAAFLNRALGPLGLREGHRVLVFGAGSVNTADQVFWQRYRRGYFRYKPDTSAHLMPVWKTSTIPGDSTFLFTVRYEVPDTSTIRLHTVIRGDSVHVELVRVARHFQLTERQFHWLSEYNR